MENSTFKLVLSNQGKEFLSTLLQGQKQEITFYISLGESKQAPSLAETGLIKEKKRVQASIVEKDSKISGLHLSALFPTENTSDEEFDIHEIGVTLQAENSPSIFLGRYASESVIGRKNNQIDFLVDLILDLSAQDTENLIINAKEYQPNFAIMHASEKNYGTVRLANDEDIKNKKPNAVLTTNVMHYFLRDDEWSVLNSAQIDVLKTIHYRYQINFIISAHFINEEQIRILFSISNRDNESFQLSPDTDNLYSFIYYLDKKNENKVILDSILQGGIPKQSIEACQYLENTTSCYIIRHEEKHLLQSTRFIFSANSYEENIDLNNFNGTYIKINKNHLLILENQDNNSIRPFIINIDSKYINEKNNPFLSNQESLLAHIVGDKVYTLENSSLSNVMILDLKIAGRPLFKSMLPLPNNENWNNISSCVMGNAIYIFMIDQFEEKYKEAQYYYRYDCADNTWAKKTITNSEQIDSKGFGLTGKVMSFGGAIYLFLMNKENEFTRLTIHVRKLIVRN